MPIFRYANHGNWYRGNTHLHSTASDGGKTFPEIEQIYTSAGYDFLFRTDHWVCSNTRADSVPPSTPLLWLDGVELDGHDHTGSGFHVVALGTFEGIRREMGLEAAMQSAREQGGLLILAHPLWMGNSFEDALRHDFDGVEVYNHVCRWLNGKGDGLAYWHAMLGHNPNTLGLASDDAHLKPEEPGHEGGWVWVNAAERTPAGIIRALRAGNFYSSTGPRFEAIEYDGAQVRFRCTPVNYMRLVGPRYWGKRIGYNDTDLFTEGVFELPLDLPYAYLEIEDAYGKRAWTNNLWAS